MQSLSATCNVHPSCHLALPQATSRCCFDAVLHTEDGDHVGYLGQFSALGIDLAEISDENFAGC